jgi:hypothetical protein
MQILLYRTNIKLVNNREGSIIRIAFAPEVEPLKELLVYLVIVLEIDLTMVVVLSIEVG